MLCCLEAWACLAGQKCRECICSSMQGCESAYCGVLRGAAAVQPKVSGLLFQRIEELWSYRNSGLVIVLNLTWQDLLEACSLWWKGSLCHQAPSDSSWERRNWGGWRRETFYIHPSWFLRDKCRKLQKQEEGVRSLHRLAVDFWLPA